MTVKRRMLGRQHNTLQRYRVIMQEFDQYNNGDVPITVIWRKYIYPKYYISRQTLYNIFNTDIAGQLNRVKEQGDQLRLF